MRDAPCLCIYLYILLLGGFSRLSKCLKRCFLTFPHLFIALDLHSRHELIIMSFKSGQRRCTVAIGDGRSLTIVLRASLAQQGGSRLGPDSRSDLVIPGLQKEPNSGKRL